MNSNQSSSFRLSIGLLSSVILVSGCSGSSSPQTVTGTETVTEANAGLEGNTASINDGDVVNDESTAATEGEPEADMLVASEVESVNTDPVVQDPLIQNSTQVTFGIMVPVYQSDALQVRLNWGEADLTANWIGDEFWSVSAELPTDTEHLLTISFSDNNGDITLGSFESTLRTGTNASESHNISFDQFDIEQWDADGDGTNNLNELIAGSNPFLNESVELEVRESYIVHSVYPVSAYYEQSISVQRPYSLTIDEQPPPDASFYEDRRSHVVAIDIDGLGNGTLSDRFQFRGAADRDISTENQEGTRTLLEGSVLWVGTYNRFNSGAGVGDDIEFSTETWAIDDQTWKQNGTVKRVEVGMSSGDVDQELSYSLVGKRLEDSTMCEPVYGTVSNKNSYAFTARENTLIVATKASDDALWSVQVSTHESELVEEFLVQSLKANFYCDFADI